MKKTILLCFIATLVIAGISSCGKTSTPDLTTNIVGVYTGQIIDSIVGTTSYTLTGKIVTISKIDNSHIQITPSDTSEYPCSAQVVQTTNGFAFFIASGNDKGTLLLCIVFNRKLC